MVKKIIDLADASTFTAGSAAQVILPAGSLNLPYLVDYLSGASTTPSRTIPIADLLNTPTTKIGVFNRSAIGIVLEGVVDAPER